MSCLKCGGGNCPSGEFCDDSGSEENQKCFQWMHGDFYTEKESDDQDENRFGNAWDE